MTTPTAGSWPIVLDRRPIARRPGVRAISGRRRYPWTLPGSAAASPHRRERSISILLVGDFNLENILSATGVALALGLAPVVIADGIRAGTCVPGRLERIREGGERFIFVDYSHKPDALENAITTLRRLTPGRLITVFGCGGDRDRTKRPVMGEIAARHSDLSVITSDNPRSEDPLGIIEAIEAGVRRVCRRRWNAGDLGASWTGPAYLVEPDRRAAIVLAIDAAQPHDTVLIAGKGHETYQILAGETIHFDDREVAREVLAAQVRKGA
ncbi:glutamate ligase domain-containing protein [Desulfosarcina cetonica]|uniref:Mur ligase family protein n=1 Tax=Desulfosarcina cetonica TaxID=90730 RepID=UPI001FEFA674